MPPLVLIAPVWSVAPAVALVCVTDTVPAVPASPAPLALPVRLVKAPVVTLPVVDEVLVTVRAPACPPAALPVPALPPLAVSAPAEVVTVPAEVIERAPAWPPG